MNKSNPKLAINGGTPISKAPIIIHKPYLDEDDFKAVDAALRSTFVSGDGPECPRPARGFAGFAGSAGGFAQARREAQPGAGQTGPGTRQAGSGETGSGQAQSRGRQTSARRPGRGTRRR